jgi:hypothetical protein
LRHKNSRSRKAFQPPFLWKQPLGSHSSLPGVSSRKPYPIVLSRLLR